MTTGECPHGMDDPAWCSVCKHGPTKPSAVEYAPLAWPARYEGRCARCDSHIYVGDLIATRFVDGDPSGWVHAECRP